MSFNKDLLNGKRILVTGGGSGLGLSMAKAFVEHGAHVILWGRDLKRLEQAKAEFAESAVKVSINSVDVRDYQQVELAFTKHFKEAPIYGLVNNAAGNFYCPSEELTPNGFKTVVDIVLNGTFNCASVFGRTLIEQKQAGVILNIETTYTETGAAFVLPSACAKAGVHALTTTLAYEWANYGIRVNSIAPGPFPTEGAWKRLMPDSKFEDLYRDRHPMRRFGQHQELQNLALFLLSDLSSYINGESVVIVGGERLGGGQFNFITTIFSRDKIKALFASMRAKTKN